MLPDLRFLVPGAAAEEDGTQAAEAAETAPPDSSDSDGKHETEAGANDAEAAETGKDALRAACPGSVPDNLQPKAPVLLDQVPLLVLRLLHMKIFTVKLTGDEAGGEIVADEPSAGASGAAQAAEVGFCPAGQLR